MGKKNKGNDSLGRSLIKSRFGGASHRKLVDDKSMLHTTEVQDGYDWGRLNLQSVTEESSFQEFLSTAELAGTEFQAEKLNIKFVNPRSNAGLLTTEEKNKAKATHEQHKDFIRIPRRPSWNSETTAAELQQVERDSFLEWRRELAELQENENVLLTPFEKNLEFWRQLWRVVERSDVVVQIVDARNPLLFRCGDLEKYVKEVSEHKINMVLINKADFLTCQQRQTWGAYFAKIGVQVAFFSAIANMEESAEQAVLDGDKLGELESDVKKLEDAVNKTELKLHSITNQIKQILSVDVGNTIINSPEILTREELIKFFRHLHKGPKVTENLTTIGLVGYPNVGKSSTINNLLLAKKVSVSATPGKTKHFQTLFLDKDLLLCDCPGLVMPSFVYTKAEMIVNGILPIDNMRDHVPPTNLVTSLIPRHVLEDTYGIMLPKPMEGEDPDRDPFAEELLNAYAYYRGFMTANGQPDNARAARYVLKDFVNGKLLYANCPPGIDQGMFHTWPERQKVFNPDRTLPPREVRAVKTIKTTTADLDRAFFSSKNHGVHTKGKVCITSGRAPESAEGSLSSLDKPWKKINKHANKNKKEKLRKVYAHLDQH